MRKVLKALTVTSETCFSVLQMVCLVCAGVLLAAQIAIVLLRYMMGVGFLELQDLVTYAFSVLVVLAVPLAYWNGRHVRVDVLSNLISPRAFRTVDRLGALLLILPVFSMLVYNAWPLVTNSFSILEGSRETGGLGGLFLVKGAVIVMCVLVILVALATILGRETQDGD